VIDVLDSVSPSEPAVIAGVDGCRAGWLVALAPSWPCRPPPQFVVCPDFRAVIEVTQTCRAVAVDMPIGLPSGAELRACDLEARRRLGPALQSRLFLTPPRGALVARSPREFQRLHRRLARRGAGLPVWGIAGKLADIDRAITSADQGRVLEAYPELAWGRLAGRLLPSKHTPAGIASRKRVLRPYVGGLRSLPRWRRQLPAPRPEVDDVLDALVLLHVADDFTRGVAHRLPIGEPPRDRRGLRMEIWF
jgi:predicted RNase H-like nuclease